MRTKLCKPCGRTRGFEYFAIDRQKRDGLRNYCRDCENERSQRYRAVKQTEPEWQERRRAAYYKSKYGLTLSEVKALVSAAETRCEICRTELFFGYSKRRGSRHGSRVCIDHSHTTGDVRGVLCDECNNGLGKFCDNPEFLQAAIDYLTQRGESD